MPENIESSQPEPTKKIEPRPITLNEMLVSAGKVYKGLIQLNNQKSQETRDVKKEVIGMPLDKPLEEVKDKEILKTPGGRTYFFDIEKTKTGNPYLRITESHINKINNNPEKNTMIVFQEGVNDFATMLTRIANKIGKSQPK